MTKTAARPRRTAAPPAPKFSVGSLVSVPDHLYQPTTFTRVSKDGPQKRVRHTVGRVAAIGRVVWLRFHGSPELVDYPLEEAAQFLPHEEDEVLQVEQLATVESP